MRALKVMVVVMALMIVAGIAVLAVTIANRMATSRGGAVPQSFTAPSIDLPAGARIETMAVGPDRAVLDLMLKDGGRELLVIDLATGKKLGTVPLRSVP
jgi:hypothetical protein